MSNPQANEGKPAQMLLTFKIIWFALTLSQLLYGFVLYARPINAGTDPLPPLPLWIPAVIAGFVSLAFFTMKLKKESIAQIYSENSLADANQKIFPFFIICWALNEAVVLFGFISIFISNQTADHYIPFLIGGVALNIYMFPKLDEHVQKKLVNHGS